MHCFGFVSHHGAGEHWCKGLHGVLDAARRPASSAAVGTTAGRLEGEAYA